MAKDDSTLKQVLRERFGNPATIEQERSAAPVSAEAVQQAQRREQARRDWK